MTFVDITFESDVMQVAGARLRSSEGAHQGPTGTASVALKGCQMTFLRWSILQDDYFSSICLFGMTFIEVTFTSDDIQVTRARLTNPWGPIGGTQGRLHGLQRGVKWRY